MFELTNMTTIQDVLDLIDEPKEVDIDDICTNPKFSFYSSVKTWTTDQFINSGEDYERIQKADCKYPILVVSYSGQYTSVIDGHHRIMKAILTNLPSIKVKEAKLDKIPSKYHRFVGKLVRLIAGGPRCKADRDAVFEVPSK